MEGNVILVSTDGGNTWETSFLPKRGFGIMRSVAAGKYVFAGGVATGILRIESGTGNWCSADSDLLGSLWIKGFAYNPAI